MRTGVVEENRVKIKTFISRYFGDLCLDDDEDIFALGFVNSLFAMELVMFVEKEFDIVVGDEDISIENFRTINSIVDLIVRKTASMINV